MRGEQCARQPAGPLPRPPFEMREREKKHADSPPPLASSHQPPRPFPSLSVSSELKQCLHAIFSQFGRILDIVAVKTLKLKGQAWVVFEDAAGAGAAIRGLQGFPFFGKPMRLTYALTRSDAAAKADGTWKPADKEARARAKAAALAGVGGGGGGGGGPPGAAAAAPAAKPAPAAADAAPPNKILFVQGLPPTTTEAMLALLFEQFSGYVEARLVPAKPGIAFILKPLPRRLHGKLEMPRRLFPVTVGRKTSLNPHDKKVVGG